MPDRLRLSIFRSHRHLCAQLINDMENRTVLGCSTQAKPFRTQRTQGSTVAAAEQLGRWIAEEAVKRGVQRVVFDRGGYRYHGRIKAFAEAARQGGLHF